MKTNKFLITLKWFILVSANAAGSFYLAIINNFNELDDILAMIIGILIFVAIYTQSEIKIRKANNEKWFNILNIGIIIRSLLVVIIPFGLGIDLISGVIAINIVAWFIEAKNFFTTLITTLVQGILLSLIVLISGIIIEWLYRTVKQRRARVTQ